MQIFKLVGWLLTTAIRNFIALDRRGKLTSLLLIILLTVGVVIGVRVAESPRTTGDGTIAPFFVPSVQYWSPQIGQWGKDYAVDPNLIATLMQIESCGLPSAESFAGAQGLFQVMPFHFPESEKTSMTVPAINAKRGMSVIKECLGFADGDFGLAMACYNGGPRWISQPQSVWPNETRRYYYWGTGIYADAKLFSRSSATLNEWLAAGGESLCGQASAALGLPTTTPAPPDFTPIVVTYPASLPTYQPGSFPVGTAAPSNLPTFAPPAP